MAELEPGEYMELIHCTSEDQVLETIKNWSSELSDREHLIRSTILDIQAGLEGLLKNVFYQILLTVLFLGEDENKNLKAKDELYHSITKMNFSAVYRILRPIFQAYPDPDLDPIPEINDLRNRIAHTRTLSDLTYKGRNPFADADSLAQVYLEAWAARDALRKFYQRMVKEPAAISAHYAQFYRENFDKNQALNNDE
jgi:hypothetical protein